MKIGILDYGLSNVGSIYSALKFYNYDITLVKKAAQLDEVDAIVIGGVGNFKRAVALLKQLKLWNKLNTEVIVKKKPVLGLCLGMQLFADVSYEGGKADGLGWIKGKVIKIKGNSMRVPHIGWSKVKSKNSEMFKGMRYNFFYFMHSYHFIPENKKVVKATTRYGDLEIVSFVQKENIYGVQFHPEKSQGDGLRFLRNFVESIR